MGDKGSLRQHRTNAARTGEHRSPGGDAEVLAAWKWAYGQHVSAMRILGAAGYSQTRRYGFLVAVCAASAGEAWRWSRERVSGRDSRLVEL